MQRKLYTIIILGFEEKMKLPGDYHTHSVYCNHAVGTLEEYVQEAVKKNLPEIGLTDHFSMYLLPETFHPYAMEKSELKIYLEEIQELKLKSYSNLKIKSGFEVDYYPTVFSKCKDALSPIFHDLDFIIGSVHGVKWENEIYPIESSFTLPDVILESKEKLTTFTDLYYQDLLSLVKTKYYDVLGHFDVITKLKTSKIPEESTREIIFRILDEIEQNGMAVEINTSGLRSSEQELYPNGTIIKELLERKIPLVLGSDAHQPIDVGYEFSSTVELLKKLGVTHTYQITRHEGESIPL
ncbi:MAG: histidinol-phosphatase HisJ [Candidatus Hodarchaeales archaeon]